ncbi:MAG: hypothetical protein ACKVT1_10640 [Dehalococcoidia bacterium]
MKPPHLLATGLLVSVFLLGGCGDGPDKAATPAASPAGQTAAATTGGTAPTPKPGDPFSRAPVLGGNITRVFPEHASTLAQTATRSPNPQRPNGACFEASFADLPENIQWFRMAFDGAEVTTKMTWVAASASATEGRGCYAPEEGFAPGRHYVAVSVQDPNNPAVSPRQVVGWEFDVR